MAEENGAVINGKENKKTARSGGTSDAVYGLALIGSAVYYISHAASFWAGVLGILKAIIWPAILAYKLLEYFKM